MQRYAEVSRYNRRRRTVMGRSGSPVAAVFGENRQIPSPGRSLQRRLEACFAGRPPSMDVFRSRRAELRDRLIVPRHEDGLTSLRVGDGR